MLIEENITTLNQEPIVSQSSLANVHENIIILSQLHRKYLLAESCNYFIIIV